jgi:serine/threonine protein kinase
MNNILGTPFYMAPEIFNAHKYDEKCDVWSIGIIMYVMLTGRPPFWGDSDMEIITQVKKGVYPKASMNLVITNTCIYSFE